MMTLTARLNNPDRRIDEPQRQPFVAPWRRRQMEQAAERERQGFSRFEAVTDTTGAVAL